jgi:hypothetical protein
MWDTTAANPQFSLALSGTGKMARKQKPASPTKVALHSET